MKSRLLALVLVFVVVLGLVPAVSAQTTPDLTCLGLSDADCQLVKAAGDNGKNIKSFDETFTFSLNVGGLDAVQPTMKEINIKADGSGPIAVDSTKMDPANPGAGLTMGLDLKGSVAGTGQDQSGTFSMVIADGNFYMKNSKGNWVGAPLSVLMQNSSMSGLPVNPATLAQGGSAAADPAAITKALQQLGLSESDINALMNVPGFLKHEKGADEAVNGVNTSPFVYTVDFTPLFASPEFDKVLNTIFTAAAKNDTSGQAAQMQMMVPMLLKQSKLTIKVTQWISPDDKFVHQLAVDVSGSIDMSALMGASGSSTTTTTAKPITLDLKFQVTLDKINQPVSVTAPAGATLAKTSEEFSKLVSGQ